MFWITCSSQSTRHDRKPCAKGNALAAAAFLASLALISTPSLAAKSTTLEPHLKAAFAPTGVFQSIELETNATTGMANWNKARRKLAAEAAQYQACDNGSAKCPPQLRGWRGKLQQWKSLTAKAKLIQVNRFANTAIAYTDDRKVFRTADYWATPMESLQGRGDCEDYVLLKYASLRALGFSEQQLRVVIVNDIRAGIGHAVLSVKTDGGLFILDNQDNRVLRHDSITRYAPVYSVNAKGRWINIATRDLKRRKHAPVVLVASADELGDIAPAAAGPFMVPTPAVKSKMYPDLPLGAGMDLPPLAQRLPATAAIALATRADTTTAQKSSALHPWATRLLRAALEPLGALLRPAIWG